MFVAWWCHFSRHQLPTDCRLSRNDFGQVVHSHVCLCHHLALAKLAVMLCCRKGSDEKQLQPTAGSTVAMPVDWDSSGPYVCIKHLSCWPWCRFIEHAVSGGASAVKVPGHFKVRKSSSQVTRMHFFPGKSWPFFSCRPQNTGHQRRCTVKIKQIKRSDRPMVTFLFSVHTITEAKQYAGLGRAKPGVEPGRWIFQPTSQVIWPGVAPPLHAVREVEEKKA